MVTDPNPTPKSRPWVRILLVVSLALNLLVIGAVVGFVIKGGPGLHNGKRGGPPSMATGGVGPLTQALSKEDRRAIVREMRQRMRDSGWDRQAHRQSLNRMVAILEARPFDADAFGVELQITVERMQGNLSEASGALLNRLADLSDDERAAYAARIRDKMARKGN
ncbi:MAG: periplasmic heavy metal sensor [Pseudomonadota bacterium]